MLYGRIIYDQHEYMLPAENINTNTGDKYKLKPRRMDIRKYNMKIDFTQDYANPFINDVYYEQQWLELNPVNEQNIVENPESEDD